MLHAQPGLTQGWALGLQNRRGSGMFSAAEKGWDLPGGFLVQRCSVPLLVPCLQEELWQTAGFHLEWKMWLLSELGSPGRAG